MRCDFFAPFATNIIHRNLANRLNNHGLSAKQVSLLNWRLVCGEWSSFVRLLDLSSMKREWFDDAQTKLRMLKMVNNANIWAKDVPHHDLIIPEA